MFSSIKRPRDPEGSIDIDENAVQKRPRALPLRTSGATWLQQQQQQQQRSSEAEDVNPQFCLPSALTPISTPIASSDDAATRGFRPESVNLSHTAAPEIEEPDSAMDLDPGRDPPLSAREGNTIDTEQDTAWTDAPHLSNAVSHGEGEGGGEPPTLASMGDNKAGGGDDDGGGCSGPASDAEMSFLLGGSCSISPHYDHRPQPGPGAAPAPAPPASSASSASRKVTFSMGFRADCEKCQQKVPGHYSHIIRS